VVTPTRAAATARQPATPAASAGPATPAVYACRVAHARKVPLRNAFSYTTYQWLVDLDQLPRLGPAARFRAADHLGDPGRSIRENVDHFLASRGIDLAGGRVLMLTNARVLGYVFNPLTVYWCHRADGALECVIAEVHNTYHERHCYLMRTDHDGRADVAKEFYVSPFYPVDGSYRMTLPEPGSRVALTVVLDRPDGHSFTATVRGRRAGTGTAALLRAAIRRPWSTAAVSGRIRWQGIRLYIRGLRPSPRPPHVPQEGVQ
jgi:DUF1365 family protein